jgi:hypothetical protein
VTKVRYTGEAGALREVGEATGKGDLIEPGAIVNVPAALARRLVASSSSWQLVKKLELEEGNDMARKDSFGLAKQAVLGTSQSP